MVGVVIVSHSFLARELLQAAEMILGPQQAIETVSVDRDMSLEDARESLAQAVERVGESGGGVLILTDLFGGTPTNLSAEFLERPEIEILTGVNLPMLLKCLGSRGAATPDRLAALLEDYARSAIMRPSEMLRAAQR